VPEFDRLGQVRGPSGTTITGIVPSNAYPSADGRQVVIGANNTANYRRLMRAAGRADLADDAELASNPGRVARQAEIDAAVAAWTRTLSADEIVRRLEAASVPASTIFTVADMAADPHYAARELFERLPVGEHEVAFPAVGPRLARTPARSDWAGRELGADTRRVLRERLGLADAEIDELARERVVGIDTD
jgi:crotonobetainyl-CoA:carnitine CoA-transferase CaiB-like acyl-CoA transferase